MDQGFKLALVAQRVRESENSLLHGDPESCFSWLNALTQRVEAMLDFTEQGFKLKPYWLGTAFYFVEFNQRKFSYKLTFWGNYVSN